MITRSAYQSIYRNHQLVSERIAQAAVSAGRDPAQVKLVVVTKGHPLEGVHAALDAGLRYFGENYAQEGVSKKLDCSAWTGVEWHMIGHIQSCKAQLVAQHYDWIHSLDNLKLAHRLDRFAAEGRSQLPVLLECNVSGEESKYGWPAWQEKKWPSLFEEISTLFDMGNLRVCGLMTMAPFVQDPEIARPYFRRLRDLRDRLVEQFPGADWHELSMGMSADFEVAVQEGATMVRIGTAIMGVRPNL